MFTVAVVVYGVGLGCVDAAANMAGALAEAYDRRLPLFGRLRRQYGRGDHGHSPPRAPSRPGCTHSHGHRRGGARRRRGGTRPAVPGTGTSPLARRPTSHQDRASAVARDLDGRRLVFAAFVVDSAVATWSTLRMEDGLGTTKAVAPLAYAAYLGVVLAGRLAADPMVPTLGRLHRNRRLTRRPRRVRARRRGPCAGSRGRRIRAGRRSCGFARPGRVQLGGRTRPDRSDEVVARSTCSTTAAH